MELVHWSNDAVQFKLGFDPDLNGLVGALYTICQRFRLSWVPSHSNLQTLSILGIILNIISLIRKYKIVD